MSGRSSGSPTDPKTGLLKTGSAGMRSFASSLLCILGGMLVGAVILFILAFTSKDIPIGDAVSGVLIILGGPFASGSKASILMNLGDMLLETTPLMLTGLSVAVAFKTGLFNIGAPGQYLMGSMGSLLVALSIPTDVVPPFAVWLLAFLAGILCGMIWGAIPGLFKALFNVNEVIVCIMCNWIAANAVSWVFSSTGERYINIAETKTKFIRPTISNNVMTPRLGLDKLFPGSNADISIFIAILIAVLMYILMNKTTLGYDLKACGYNKNAAKYAGMNEKRSIVFSMILAGGLAAAGAALWYLNGKNDFLWNTYSTLPNDGFNGIPVALLASNNPLGVIFSSLFLRYIGRGGFNLAGYTHFNEYVSNLIIAVIIYFAGFSKLIKGLLGRREARKMSERERKAEELSAPNTGADTRNTEGGTEK